jgi:glycosyltransferase involved in cell wall biosynthesis
MPIILINDTAARSSGALSILKDCIAYLEFHQKNDTEYHLCTVVNDFDTIKNIHIHKMKPGNWVDRIVWDNGGLQRWCRLNRIEPDIIISLQNTSTKYYTEDKLLIPQVVYFQHAFPIIPHKWNVFMKQEFVLFLHAHFYPFFVNLNNESSIYVVQLDYIREHFLKKFKKIAPERVFVIRPNSSQINTNTVAARYSHGEYFTFLYPETAFNYKNHKIIVQALALLKQQNYETLQNIRVVFTIQSLPNETIAIIKRNKLENIVQCIGQISHSEIISYYKSVDALLFPSKIESFGLPLLEASFFGLPIIAADLPYAREVLNNYTNKLFVDPDDNTKWSKIIQNYQDLKKINVNNLNNKNTWEDFFKLTETLSKIS